MIEPIPRDPLMGGEQFTGMPDTSVMDFWRFALPNLQVNAARGWFAEFLVSKALGIEHPIRLEWDDYDVIWEGLRIEVKSSGRMQAWVQHKVSELRFTGLSSRSWSLDSTTIAAERSYNSDLYVFAVHTAESHEAYEQLDIDQWRFAVLTVAEVESTGYRSLGWAAVLKLAGGDVGFAELKQEVLRRAQEVPGRSGHNPSVPE